MKKPKELTKEEKRELIGEFSVLKMKYTKDIIDMLNNGVIKDKDHIEAANRELEYLVPNPLLRGMMIKREI